MIPGIVAAASSAGVAPPSGARWHHGQFLTGTGTSPIVINDLPEDFEIGLILFFWSGHTTSSNGIVAGDIRTGFGFARSTSARCNVGGQSDHGVGTTVTDWQFGNDSVVRVLSTAGALAGALDLTSVGTSTFTLTPDTAFTVDLLVNYIAIEGGNITDVDILQVTEPAATGDQTYTPGFQADLLLALCAPSLSAPPSQGAHHTWAFGACVRGGNQAIISARDRDAVGFTDAQKYQSSGHFIGRMNATANSMAALGSVTTFGSTNFVINWSRRAATGVIYFVVAIKGGNWHVGELQTQTDTTTPIAVSGLTFPPEGVLFFSHQGLENTSPTIPFEHCCMSFGVATAADARRTAGFMQRNLAGTSDCFSGQRDDACYMALTGSGGQQALMDCQGLTSDGFNCIMDDADTAQNTVYFLAGG